MCARTENRRRKNARFRLEQSKSSSKDIVGRIYDNADAANIRFAVGVETEIQRRLSLERQGKIFKQEF